MISFLWCIFLVDCRGRVGVFGSMFARDSQSSMDLSFAFAKSEGFVKAGGWVVCEGHTQLCGSPLQSRI